MSTKTHLSVALNPIQTMVGQFLNYCQESRGMSISTIKTRKTHLNQFAQYCLERGVLNVSDLSPAFIDDYFTLYQKTHTKNTANTGRRILKVFLAWLIGYKELSVVKPEFIRLVKTPKTLPKALNVKDVLKVISSCKHPTDALMIAVLLESGIRISELVSIRVEDVHFDAILIHGKGSIERTVYISQTLAQKLSDYMENKYPHDFLFQNVYKGYGQKMTVGTARLRIQKAFKSHDIGMHPHQLRHTFAVNLLTNGCDIVTIQKLLGHADIQTTQVYLNVTDNFLRERHKMFMFFDQNY